MKDSEKTTSGLFPIGINEVEDKIAVIRGIPVIADADVAALYGVKTKEVNQAVYNNPDKFPSRYMFELSMSELHDLRSKILTTNVSLMNRNTTKVFTERGLYGLCGLLCRVNWEHKLITLQQNKLMNMYGFRDISYL